MKKENLIIPGIVVGVLVVFFFLMYFTKDKLGSGNNVEIDKKDNLETKTSEGQVVIDLKPLGVKDGKFLFDINVNTHTISLEQYDLRKLITLEFDGNKLNPSSAPKLTEHHNSGVLTFNIDKNPTAFKIIIRDIPDVKERMFEWK